MERKFNKIYRRLVKDEYDVEGHIAYSLYKLDKEKFIEDFIERNGGKIPAEDDLIPFHSFSCLDTQLSKYRLMANSVLQNFLGNVLQDSIKEIEEATAGNYQEILSDIIKPISPPSKWRQFWNGMFQSVAGAFIFALILAAIGFISFFRTSDINVTFTKENEKGAIMHSNPIQDTTSVIK